MYYKEHLPSIKRDDLHITLKECLVIEIRVNKKKMNLRSFVMT